MLKKIIKIIGLSILLLSAGLIVYGWYLSAKVEKRFAGRRWSIPSTVFSDITTLYPGQRINRVLFNKKLNSLGYREVSHTPLNKGEKKTAPSEVTIYLHDLKIPSLSRKGFPVNIRFLQNKIEAINRTDIGKPIPILELEPEEIMRFFGPEREKRHLVSIQQVPEDLIYAVLAAEDGRFYQHHGIDPRGILRALHTNLRHGAIRQGGSTLTQQLAKNYFLTPERTISRKINEAILSIIIEAIYEKDEILEIYLNEIYLGQKGSVSINGVGEASSFYFDKPVSKLSLPEAATIAGLIKGPNHYSPYVDKFRCRERRNRVLHAMHRKGWISNDKLEGALSAKVEPSGFNLQQKKAPYFIDYLYKQIETLYPVKVLNSLGLSIYTTLDTQVQAAAELALEKGLARLEKSIPALRREKVAEKLQGAVIVVQPKTGYILAMVGGRNYAASQFNRITQSRRQPGSAFKPFVYLTSLEEFNPASRFSNDIKTYVVNNKEWAPQNFSPSDELRVSMRMALAKSHNLATVDLAMKTGLDKIVHTATRFHFSTPVKPYPSLALGAFEVIPIELARAYCVFAADGMLPYPLSLKDVTDENKKLLKQKHMHIQRLTSPAKAFMISSMLRSVTTDGTARSLLSRGISWPVAGKTGTTNNFRDAWFVGYTPDIMALVWIGFDNQDSIFTTGSVAALPIWADLMNSVPQYVSENWYKTPPGIVKKTVCSESGLLAHKGCPESMEEIFLKENVPTVFCPIHNKPGLFRRLFNFTRKEEYDTKN
ncbi:MAG: PBP1A family penicillin-binding protein [Thermodesulfobacteriota bacterium]|nr:PBP1A family penicillin-binding protein [Thermodesulfobacteriota bacterium]